jgi:hypothetical protein
MMDRNHKRAETSLSRIRSCASVEESASFKIGLDGISDYVGMPIGKDGWLKVTLQLE